MLRKLNFRAVFCLLIFVFPFTLLDIEIRAEGRKTGDDDKPEILRLAAWNIQNLGFVRERKRDPHERQKIADILSSYHFIAITELMHKKNLKPYLGLQGRIIKLKDEDIEKLGDGKIVKLEHEKFQQLKQGKILDLKDEDFEALEEEGDPGWDFKGVLEILSQKGRNYSCLISPKVGTHSAEHYALLYDEDLVSVVKVGSLYPDMDDDTDDFERAPYWATFCAGEFDFTVVVVHTKPDDAEKECQLMDEVYAYVQEENGDEQDVLLVGDFNLQPNDAAFNHLKTRLDFKVDPLILPPKTTNILNTELYDNIFLQPYYLNEYNGQSDVCLFDEDIFGNDDKKAKRISDHRPVWAEFNTHKDDDPKKPESDAGDSGR